MDQMLAIGVDIGGTRTKSGLINIVTGEVIGSIIQPTEKKDARLFLEQVGFVIQEFKQMASLRGIPIKGIGIGVPGFTNEDGIVVTTYGFLEYMENYPLESLVEKEFLLSCLIDNDARVVSLGEALFGHGKGYKRVLTLTLGTGVGFGLVINGKFTDALPLSHMGGNIAITNEGGKCYCGKMGCLEALVSSNGILNLAHKNGFSRDVSVQKIFEAAKEGILKAMEVVEKVIEYLHIAIHNYVNLFAPDMIVLGGGIAKSLLPYTKKIKGKMYMGPYPGYNFELAISQLEESAGMLGSAALFNALHNKIR